ncbi:hypothetical protein QY049_03600 [Bradyrhizobium sp. WYCCWR 13022]|uniref:hypothetical protein n=1 Tax=unclassified Bradyrhizobium TaxID=2631580 RepID=UPI00263BC720|nr:hypothetical protein [Bradyrhizobium sp. WYCCWR 13022]MDN4982308.1 hypothetical protein [Bradyrhizobium sp. WYCCWR 13022]
MFELNEAQLETVAGSGLGLFGQLFIPTILKTSSSSTNQAPTGPSGPAGPTGPSTTGGGYPKSSFDPVGVRF